jgi:hypothetical protein
VPLPVGITTTTVTMTFVGQDGTPATGTVTFTPSKATWVDDITDKVVILPDPVIGVLDSNGHSSVSLVPTDSAAVTPHGWTYDVLINVFVGTLNFTQTFAANVTQSPSTVDLVNLAPVQADGSGGIKAVLKVNTKLPDSTGNVTLTAADVGALATAPVASVNAKTGVVVLNATDVGAIATGGAVTSVNGHTGTSVTLQASDVSAVPVRSPVTLTSGAIINTDVSLGRHFKVVLTGNDILTAPTGSPVDGQTALWEFIQDSTGSRLLTIDISGFKFGTDVTLSSLSTTPGAHDFMGAIYNATAAIWDVILFIRGY